MDLQEYFKQSYGLYLLKKNAIGYIDKKVKWTNALAVWVVLSIISMYLDYKYVNIEDYLDFSLSAMIFFGLAIIFFFNI